MFHPGHVNLLRRAKALGDYLIVALSTDDFNQLKAKKSVLSIRAEKNSVRSLSLR